MRHPELLIDSCREQYWRWVENSRGSWKLGGIIDKADIMEKRHEVVVGVGSEEGVLGKRIVLSSGDGEHQGFQPGGA